MAGKLEERVKDIIVEQLGVNAEQVAIPEEDAESLTTVGKVVDYLKSKGYGDDGSAPAQ